MFKREVKLFLIAFMRDFLELYEVGEQQRRGGERSLFKFHGLDLQLM